MSLIHDAIKEMNHSACCAGRQHSPELGAAPLFSFSSMPSSSPALTLKPGILFVLLAAAFAGAGGWYWQSQAASRPTPAPTPAADPTQSAPLAAATSPPPPAPVSIASTTPVHTPSPLTDPPRPSADSQSERASAETGRTAPMPPHASRPSRHGHVKAAAPQPSEARPAPAAAPVVTVEQHYALLSQALAAHDADDAQGHLAALEQQLPPESLTLLRARAWYLSKTQDAASARSAYRMILERLPGDENAGLNLAALEAQAGRIDAARTLLSEVLHEHPESTGAQQAIAQLSKGRP